MDRRHFISLSGLSLGAACSGSAPSAGNAETAQRAGNAAEGRYHPAVTHTSPLGHKVIHDRFTLIEQFKYEDWNPKRNWKDDASVWLAHSYKWGQLVEPIQRRPGRILENLYLLGPDDYHQCVYLWDTGSGLLLIDPSYDRFSALVNTQIRQLGYELSDVKWVLLTHMHWDHSQCAAQWEARGVPVYIHEDDRGYMTGELDLGEQSLPVTPVKNPLSFAGGDTLTFGRLSLRAIHTPGHTPGSACFSFDWAGTSGLISGDIVLHFGRHAWMGAGYCNWDQYLASLWRLHDDPDAAKWQVLLPGHGTVELEGAPDSIWQVMQVTSHIIHLRRQGSDLDWIDSHHLFWRLKQEGEPEPDVLKA
ncbi:MAG: MBL fold metallo-hydrolase [Candidatus Glassbacteria bacterium]|nr:MBL fold metallo-hydrolase [Candidatus Glassbacteria bacterium]